MDDMKCFKCSKEVEILTSSKFEVGKLICNACTLVEIHTEGYDDLEYIVSNEDSNK